MRLLSRALALLPWCATLLALPAEPQDTVQIGTRPQRTRPARIRNALEVENFELGASYGFVEGNTVVSLVSEPFEGVDLNGDGDTTDIMIPHIHDRVSGSTVSLGLASRFAWHLEGRYFFYGVWEREQGGTDLNGDGDNADLVVHLYDLQTGTNTNLGLAGLFLREGDSVILLVDESSQGGIDLDSNGSADDHVAHELILESGAITNLGVSGHSNFVLRNGTLSFAVLESVMGDLNLDGDAEDAVIFAHDLGSQTTRNLELALHTYATLDENYLVFPVRERDQGNTDLNGDGDVQDSVLHVFDTVVGTVTNLGLDVRTWRVANERVWMSVREDAVDLNQDGDLLDLILHIHDIPGGSTVNLGIATVVAIPDADRGLFLALEADNGAIDLNGDGDASDWVPHVYDAELATLSNLGIAVSSNDYLRFAGDFYAALVSETAHGNRDLNGDGDATDTVVAVHRFSTGRTWMTGLAADALDIAEGIVTCRVPEASQGHTDLNRDGDALDHVFFACYPNRRLLLGSRVSGWGASLGLRDGHNLLVTVDEGEQGGRDLNGDGDALDEVLHVIDLTLH